MTHIASIRVLLRRLLPQQVLYLDELGADVAMLPLRTAFINDTTHEVSYCGYLSVRLSGYQVISIVISIYLDSLAGRTPTEMTES